MRVLVAAGNVVFAGPLGAGSVAYVDADQLPEDGEAEIEALVIPEGAADDDRSSAALRALTARVRDALAGLDGVVEIVGGGVAAQLLRDSAMVPEDLAEGAPAVIVDLTGHPESDLLDLCSGLPTSGRSSWPGIRRAVQPTSTSTRTSMSVGYASSGCRLPVMVRRRFSRLPAGPYRLPLRKRRSAIPSQSVLRGTASRRSPSARVVSPAPRSREACRPCDVTICRPSPSEHTNRDLDLRKVQARRRGDHATRPLQRGAVGVAHGQRGKRPEWVYEPAGWDASSVKGWDVKAMKMTHARAWPGWVDAIRGTGPLGVDFCRAMREDAGGVFATVPQRDLAWAHNTVMSYGYVLALTARGRSELAVLDWGGGAGQYYLLSKALLPGVTFDYQIRENEQVCEIGRELCPDATFHTADETIEGEFDLAYSASALQFIEDWKHVVRSMARVVA